MAENTVVRCLWLERRQDAVQNRLHEEEFPPLDIVRFRQWQTWQPSPSANSNVFIIIISSSNSRGKLGLSEDFLADQSWWSTHKSVKVQ